MKLRPMHLMLLAVTVVVIGMVVAVTGGETPGSVKADGAVITKIVSATEADATAVFDIVLQEGNDAEHESTHIFQQLDSPAIARLLFDTETLKLTIEYDSAQADEQMLRAQLATTGYVQRSAADATRAELSADGLSQTIHLVPGEVLTPSFVTAVPGVPLTVTFSPGTGHLTSVTIPELGLSQTLASEGASITIENPAPGEYSFVCAEGYADAVLLIE